MPWTGPLWALSTAGPLPLPAWTGILLLGLAAVLAIRLRIPLPSDDHPISFHPFLGLLAVAWLGFGLGGMIILALVHLIMQSVDRARHKRRRDVTAYLHTALDMTLTTLSAGLALSALAPLRFGFLGLLGAVVVLSAGGNTLSTVLLLGFLPSGARRPLLPHFFRHTIRPAVTIDVITFATVWGLSVAGGAAGFVVGTAILGWFSIRLQQVLVATEQANALVVAEADARHDPLTTLPNRRGLEEYAAQITAAGLPCVIALADIDHFKAVNDTYGHDGGDVILFAVAQRLRHACRTQRPPWPDMVGRWGGEEFVLILPKLPATAAPARVEAMRRAVGDRTVPCQGHAVRVTLSVGATLIDVPPLHLAAAVDRADQAMYRAKAGGRDGLRWYPDLLPFSGAVTLHPVRDPVPPPADAGGGDEDPRSFSS